MTTTAEITLGLFLLNNENRKDFESSIEEINRYLALLDPNLSEKQKKEILLK